MAYILKFNPFTENFDWVLDSATIAGVIRPYSNAFAAADLDVDGNLAIDITALGAAGIENVTIRDENGISIPGISFLLAGNIITVYLASPGIAGNWNYCVNYWL